MKDLKFTLSFDERGRVKYQPGDIVGVRGGKGPITWLSYHAVVPQTPLFHFLLIGYPINGDDYTILESIGKGPALGRLAWYKDREYVVFRVNHEDGESLGERAWRLASKFGRRRYDWKLYVKIFAWALGYWLKEIFTGHIPPRLVYPTMIPYKTDQDFICIELVFEAWKEAGFRIREHGHAPVPAEVILAQGRGDLEVIDSHDGNPANWRAHKSPLYTAARQIAEDHKPKAGRDLIGQQKGQKRNRVHLYRQPFGYPIRACDWKAVDKADVEVIAELTPVPGLEKQTAEFALTSFDSRRVVCKHCLAVAQGKRNRVLGDS